MLLILTVADIKAVGPGRVERLEGPAPADALLRDRAGADRRPQPGRRDRRVADAKAELASGACRLAGGRARRRYLERHYPAYWLRVDLPRKVAHANFIRAAEADRQGALATDVRARRLRGGDRDHRAGARPSAAPLDHRRRLHDRRRQHRRRADLHHHRRPGARHDLDQPRIRPTRPTRSAAPAASAI